MRCLRVLAAAAICAPAITVAQQPDPCASPTTAAMRMCAAQKLGTAEGEMQRYLDAARRVARPPAALDASQTAWMGYRDHACRAAASQYDGGSLQPVVALDCRLRLTHERTRELWRAYLVEDDAFPEPRAAR